jgi:hypothetical protein
MAGHSHIFLGIVKKGSRNSNRRIIMKRVSITTLILATATWALPACANEENPLSYSYIEGGYMHSNLESDGALISDEDGVGDTSDDNFGTLSDHAGHGWAGRFSLGLINRGGSGLYVAGGYLFSDHIPGVSVVNRQGATASGAVDADQKELRLVMGAHFALSPKVSLFAELGVAKNTVDLTNVRLNVAGSTVTADISSASGNRTALDGKLGIRAMASAKLELTGYARYHGNGDIGGDGTALTFSSKVKAGAGAFYHFNRRFAVGGDYEFGKPGRVRLVARISF